MNYSAEVDEDEICRSGHNLDRQRIGCKIKRIDQGIREVRHCTRQTWRQDRRIHLRPTLSVGVQRTHEVGKNSGIHQRKNQIREGISVERQRGLPAGQEYAGLRAGNASELDVVPARVGYTGIQPEVDRAARSLP